ncbi:MAG: hypothetical protein WAO58_09980 [Fimbriimonadaceae bacterium]
MITVGGTLLAVVVGSILTAWQQSRREGKVSSREAIGAVHSSRQEALLKVVNALYSVDYCISMCETDRLMASFMETNLAHTAETASKRLPGGADATETTDPVTNRLLDALVRGGERVGEKREQSLDHRRAQRRAAIDAFTAASSYGHYPEVAGMGDRLLSRDLYGLLYVLSSTLPDDITVSARNLLYALCEDLGVLAALETRAAQSAKAGQKWTPAVSLEVLPTFLERIKTLQTKAEEHRKTLQTA